MRVEADDVVREQPVVDRVPDRLGKHAPEVRLRPGNVHEVGERGIGPRLAHEPRREVEVVVVEDDRRVGLRVQLGEGGLGEGAVDRHVAVLPRVVETWIDVRRVGERPQVVLEEPERRVCDDVVEPVVGGRVVGDEPQPVRRAVAGNLLDGLAAGLVGDRPVLDGDRAGDPGHVVMGDEAPQRRHEPSAPTAGDAIAVLVAGERDRPPVRDDDQLPASRHRRWTLSSSATKPCRR